MALIAILVYAGLRIGEATALTWNGSDLADDRIIGVLGGGGSDHERPNLTE